MKIGYQCDSCKSFTTERPWDCPGCNTETCDKCFDLYAHCKRCSGIHSKLELIEIANLAGWDFEL